jgi:DNA-binding transcriptional LysR family regulator
MGLNTESAVGRASVRLSAIDLNLLVVFDAVMQERNVTRAGARLGLSQPAMSHALTRLRHMLKDELFIRTPKGMIPTPRAEQLASPVKHALEGLQHSLEPDTFEPSQTKRTFRIAVDNYAAIVLVGPLVASLTNTAPGIIFDFRPSGTLNIVDLLDRGALDLAIGPFAQQGERFSRQSLLEDRFAVVLRRDHPACAARSLSIEKLAELGQLEISSIQHATDFVDQALAKLRLARRVRMRAPYLAAARILASSDMACILPKRVAEELVCNRQLVARPVSHPTPPVEIAMTWPRWLDNQPAHRWLRSAILAAAKHLGSE